MTLAPSHNLCPYIKQILTQNDSLFFKLYSAITGPQVLVDDPTRSSATQNMDYI